MLVADEAVRVDQVAGVPVTIGVGASDSAVIIEDDRVFDDGLPYGLFDAGEVLLKLELQLVYSDDLQSVFSVLLVETIDVRSGTPSCR